MSEPAIIVDWFGPYADVREACRDVKTLDDYIYLGLGYPGKLRRRGRPTFMYAGKCNGGSRVRHLANDDATYTSIWLGMVASHQKSGPRKSKTRHSLVIAEKAYIFALKPQLNKRQVESWPSDTIFLLNRWWNNEYSKQIPKPAVSWPDIITCDPDQTVGYKIFLGPAKPRVQLFKRT